MPEDIEETVIRLIFKLWHLSEAQEHSSDPIVWENGKLKRKPKGGI